MLVGAGGREEVMAISSFGSYTNGTRHGNFVNHLPVKKARDSYLEKAFQHAVGSYLDPALHMLLITGRDRNYISISSNQSSRIVYVEKKSNQNPTDVYCE